MADLRRTGGETLGLRPALRQAARHEANCGGGSGRQRPGGRGFVSGRSHDKPPSGDSLREFVLRSLRLSPLLSEGARACLRDMPCACGSGHVVYRYSFSDTPLESVRFGVAVYGLALWKGWLGREKGMGVWLGA